MSYTNDLTNLANIASVVTSGITSNGTAITKISVGNSTVNSVVNSTGIYVNGSVIYQTTDGLSANVLVLTSNAATYLGNSSGTLANIQNYITGNAATAYTNATSYADTKAGTSYTNATSYADTVAANAYTNATSYANTAAGNAYTNATSYADIKAGNAYTNATSYADTKAANAYSNAITYSANADNISSGTVTPARLGTGTANSTTILYGNGVFALAPDGVNTAFQYTFTNTISFSSNVTIVNTATLTAGNSTVNSTLSAANSALYTPTLRGLRETVLANTNAAGAMTLDLSYTIHRWTLTGNVTSLNYTNVPANNTVFTGTLHVTANATGTNATNRAITFPSTANATTGKTLWSGAAVPPQTSSNSAVDIYSFFTIDGGNNYVWSLVVKDAR